MTPSPFHRHDLAWLGPGWRARLLSPLAPADEATVIAWVARGLPAVVRRLDGGAPAEAVALGLALPGPGRRLGLLVEPGAIARRAGPVPLRDALAAAPAPWRAPLAALEAGLAAAGTSAAVFGSLAWQHLVDEPYLRSGSDVDLLLRPRDPAAPWGALAVLAAHDAGQVRLDGELLVGAGLAVAWRELLRRPRTVLVKSASGAALRPLAALVAPPPGRAA